MIRRALRTYIEQELRDYHKNKQSLWEIQAGINDEMPIHASPAPPDAMPRGNTTSDPTERKAEQLEEWRLLNTRRINNMYRITYGIGRVLETLPPEKLRLIKLKYWKHPQPLNDVGLAMEMCCGQNTFYRWRNEICAQIARELGMM